MKIKMWIFKKLFKNICKIYEDEIYKRENQIENLKKRIKFYQEQEQKYKIIKNWTN